jgi:redox-sensitive bicupin YhaK (pirin superfamily)
MKRVKPGYLGAPTETVPQIVDGAATVRVVAGEYKGTNGSFQDIAVKPTVLDVQISNEGSVEIPTQVGESAFIYVVRGRAKVGPRTVDAPEMVVLTDGDSLTVSAGPEGTRFLFVSAKPLDEPILQYRSFVMNSVEDIAETLDLIHVGTFGNGE